MNAVVAVVLAAGSSTRFGGEKLLAVLPDGERLIERALRAAAAYRPCAVVSERVLPYVRDRAATIVLNEWPELGMAHSLRLANERIDAAASLLAMPADLALIEPEHVAIVAAYCGQYDVVYPRDARGVPGHPVAFSPRARAAIAALAPGEPIRTVRDREGLSRRVLAIDAPWPYRDVDRPGDLEGLACEP